MKNTIHCKDTPQKSLGHGKAKCIAKLSDWVIENVSNSRECLFFLFYEPTLEEEVLEQQKRESF